MRIMVVGGGKVGSYLARKLRQAGHIVTVIEIDEDKAGALAADDVGLVFDGDGTSVATLSDADVDRADWVLAVTGHDEDNFVACQLARTLGAGRVLARLNDPRNRPTFAALQIPVVAVTDLMTQVISREVEVDVEELVRLALLGRGQVSLLEIDIPAEMPDRRVDGLRLPPGSVLVVVVRGEDIFVPRAETILHGGDRVLAVTGVASEIDLRRALCTVVPVGEGASPR